MLWWSHAAVTAEAVGWRDNGATCCQLSPDTGFNIFRAVGQTAYTFWSQYAYVTSKVLGLKQPKDTFSGPTKRCIFSQGLPFFLFSSFYLLLCAWQTLAILTWRYTSWWAAWGKSEQLCQLSFRPGFTSLISAVSIYSPCCRELSGPRTSNVTKKALQQLVFQSVFSNYL